jgi:hypothetical protein
VLGDGGVAGRIMKSAAVPVGMSWMWTLAFGHHEDRTPTHGYAATRAPAMPNGRCRMHGGLPPGAPKGNKNVLKRGRYTAEAIERRREISALLRAMKALARNC